MLTYKYSNLCAASSTPSELFEPNGANHSSPRVARRSPAPRSKVPPPAAVAPPSQPPANQDGVQPIVPQRVDVVGGMPPQGEKSVRYHGDFVHFYHQDS